MILVTKLKIGKCTIIQKLGFISLYIYLIEGHFLRWKGYFLKGSHSNIANVLVFISCIIGGYAIWQIANTLQKKCVLRIN